MIKFALRLIAAVAMALLFSVNDFVWPAIECPEYELSQRVLDGSDGACAAAVLETDQAMRRFNAECLIITNKGWTPVGDLITRDRLDRLLEIVRSGDPYRP